MEELLDVLDNKGNETGATKTKADMLRDGDWRKVVHVWVVGSGGLWVKKRATNVPTFKGLLDVSVGGGVRSGEESVAAAVRELHEELGISCSPEDLEYLGRWQQSPKQLPAGKDGNSMYDNDFSDTYLLRRNVDAQKLRLQADEVASAEIMPLSQLVKEIKDPQSYAKWVPHGVDYYTEVASLIK